MKEDKFLKNTLPIIIFLVWWVMTAAILLNSFVKAFVIVGFTLFFGAAAFMGLKKK